MKKQYNIIVGLALLATIAACYAFKNTRYYSIKTGEEFTHASYARYKNDDEFNYLVREESFLNYQAGFTAGMVSLGLGLLVMGLKKRTSPGVLSRHLGKRSQTFTSLKQAIPNFIIMTENQTMNYPNNGQSWGIVGMIILSMLLFSPVNFLLNEYTSKDLSFLVYYLVAMGVPFWIAHQRRKGKTNLGNYACDFSSPKVIALVVLAVIAIQIGIIVPLVSLLPMPGFVKQLFLEFAKNNGVFAFIAMVIAAPVLEELIFRGIILHGLLKIYPPFKSILISSILFGVVHLNPWQFITALILGLFSGWAYYKTRSLTLSILIHFVNNLMAAVSVQFAGVEASIDKSLSEQYGGMMNLILIVLAAIFIAIVCLYFIRFEFNKIEMNQNQAASIS